MEDGVERSAFDHELPAAPLVQTLHDRVPVSRLVGEHGQHQSIEMTLQEFRSQRSLRLCNEG
jgi:hypothetical protein